MLWTSASPHFAWQPQRLLTTPFLRWTKLPRGMRITVGFHFTILSSRHRRLALWNQSFGASSAAAARHHRLARRATSSSPVCSHRQETPYTTPNTAAAMRPEHRLGKQTPAHRICDGRRKNAWGPMAVERLRDVFCSGGYQPRRSDILLTTLAISYRSCQCAGRDGLSREDQ